jgi:transmembrane sensor
MTPSQERMRKVAAMQAAEWFVAHRSGEMSEMQRDAFIDWLRASQLHVREYLALTGFASDLGHAARAIATPTDLLVAQARAERTRVTPLFLEAHEGVAVRAQRWPASRVWIAACTFAVLALSVAFFGFRWLEGRTHYSTAHAEQRSWRLKDGSTVHLNSSSAIRIDFDEKRRYVELLEGQAVFQVRKDPARPFWVHVGDTIVKAVGTQFDVQRLSQGALVSVMEGRVAIWRVADASAEQIARVIEPDSGAGFPAPIARLDAGQQARIVLDEAKVSKRSDDVRKTVAWLQRQIVFDHDPLGAAVDEFNRYNELRIRLDDPGLRAVEISGIFSAYDTESFIRFLERQPGMRLRRAGNEVVVSAVEPSR